MEGFSSFLGFINAQLCSKGIHRLESFMMAANFSSLVPTEFYAGADWIKLTRSPHYRQHHKFCPYATPPRRCVRACSPARRPPYSYAPSPAVHAAIRLSGLHCWPPRAVQRGSEGIEIKASRYGRGWQGHNAEDTWLMVFAFDSNTSRLDKETNQVQAPRPFQFVKVVGAKIAKSDWQFSGRSETSRRTITASVTRSGYEKMEANWIYRHSGPLPPKV